MDNNIKDMLEVVMSNYPFEHQREVFVEECAEAVRAVQKCKRANSPEDMREAFENLCEEVADVSVMVEQMKLFIGVKKVEGIMKDKLLRQLERLEISAPGSDLSSSYETDSLVDKHWSECRQIAHYQEENKRLREQLEGVAACD